MLRTSARRDASDERGKACIGRACRRKYRRAYLNVMCAWRTERTLQRTTNAARAGSTPVVQGGRRSL